MKTREDGETAASPDQTQSSPARYDIYEREGAVFRTPTGLNWVTEVWRSGPGNCGFDFEGDGKPGRWLPYDGDRRKPVADGDLVRSNVSGDE